MSRTTAKRLAQLEEWLRDPTCRRALIALAQSYQLKNLDCRDDQVIAGIKYGSWLAWFTPVRMVLNRDGFVSVYQRTRAEGVVGKRDPNGKTHIDLWEWIGTAVPHHVLEGELPDDEADCFVSDVFCWLASGEVPESSLASRDTCSVAPWARIPERREDAK